MAEPSTDRGVDECIADVQKALDRLKAAQRQDDEAYDEEGDDTPQEKQPKSLRGAARKARAKFRQGRGEKASDDSDE